MNPFTLLEQGLGALLAFFYSVIPNYGIAIIMLTLVVSLLLFPLTLKQTRSMRAMQEIQPEVKRLQKELKGDREELNKQLMALYQERGVNPAAGCLPLLAQMPIWFALFRVLRVDVNAEGTLSPDNVIPPDSDLAGALLAGDNSFLGMNLSLSPAEAVAIDWVEAIPYLILILVVVATGFYQQYQTTRRRDGQAEQSQQAQSMQTAMKIMPLVFGFISWGFPAGLVLYFATSNLFRIGQQALIARLDESHEDGGSGGEKDEGRGGKGPDDAPPKDNKGPSPNASKKRNRRRRK